MPEGTRDPGRRGKRAGGGLARDSMCTLPHSSCVLQFSAAQPEGILISDLEFDNRYAEISMGNSLT